MRYLALLRGVNVGGARMLPILDLENAFRACGASAVATVIQSGNVVFVADDPELTCTAVATAIGAKFGFLPSIALRSEIAWRTLVEANPFVAAAVPLEMLHVACLAAEPRGSLVASIDPRGFLPDEFVRIGGDVYLKLPNGVANAKLTNARLDRMFAGLSTMRNWRTVLLLLDRLEA